MSLKSLHLLGRTCCCRESLQIFTYSASILTRNKGDFHTWFQRCWFSTSRKTYSSDAKSQNDQKESSAEIPVEHIRNFSIIAHVDHGKSTLADRLLELTGAWSPTQADRKGPGRTEQVLDKLQVEQERGITVKAQCARLLYKHQGTLYHLNLIDTPGHVDFSNEVSRSVAVCQGVLLLVDANQGIQAQTLANYHLAAKRGLVVIPVLNKCDLKQADPDGVALQLEALIGVNPDSAIKISAKTGMGVPDVLRSIVEQIPPPPANRDAPLRAVMFDGWMDTFKGAITLLSLMDGRIRVGDRISVIRPVENKISKTTYEVKGLGQLCPEELPRDQLVAGEVGFMNCNMKTTSEAALGSTVHLEGKPVKPFDKFPEAKPVVFASIFPVDRGDFPRLRTAIEKLTLNDSGVVCTHETTMALGAGFRLGFLGLLHMEVFIQRLEDEYDADTIVTSPSVMYKAFVLGKENKKSFGKEITVSSASNIPIITNHLKFLEPMILATVLTPDDHIADILKLSEEKRGQHLSTTELGGGRSMLKLKLPLNEVVVDFHDRLKSVTSGYASFDYEDCGYQPTAIIKLDVLLNHFRVPELSTLVHASKATEVARTIAAKLRDTIPRRQFMIVVQIACGKIIFARENIKPYRKDVTAKLYGGDDTRRMKLVAQQKAGKKKMRSIGNIDIPRKVYIDLLKN